MRTEQIELQEQIGNTEKDIIIKLNYKPDDYTADLLKLPFETKDQHSIRYIIPYYEVEHVAPDIILDKERKLKTP